MEVSDLPGVNMIKTVQEEICIVFMATASINKILKAS